MKRSDPEQRTGPARPDGTPPRRRRVWRAAAIVALVSLLFVALRIPVLHGLGLLVLSIELFVLLVWLAVTLLRLLLWRVGRRLAFTYFLIGVLPVPMVLAMLFVAAYLLSGFYLGHLYRVAASSLHHEVRAAAAARLADWRLSEPTEDPPSARLAAAFYRNGRRVGGDERAPVAWPAWLEGTASAEPDAATSTPLPPLVSLDDERMTVAAAVSAGEHAVLAFFDGDLEPYLSRRSGVWVDLILADDPRKEGMVTLELFGETFALQPLRRPGAEAGREEFLDAVDPNPALRIIGFELSGPLYDFADGQILSPSVSATLTATPTLVRRYLFPSAAEVDTLAWIGFIVPAFLLFDIYAVAVLMAVLMILGLSRAVNRLSRATAAVQAGNFAVRIPVRRRDQVGALQHSFNRMAANLQELVAAAARKESLEKELEIARDLQQSLLPSEVVQGGGVAFSTFFQPSAAIGGDYFDIFPLGAQAHEDGHRRLAVVIADVSGHGLSAGLVMAMIKAALLILVQEQKQPHAILAALDQLVRAHARKAFVTATLARLDLESGRLELTNAGHPPTYLLRGGEVEEILLPSPPLGALGSNYSRHEILLQPGDVLVWLSDGFIEATASDGESFGYDRTRDAICGDGQSAEAVRDRFLEAVRHYTDDRAAEDDCTLVVMHYQPAATKASGGPDLHQVVVSS